MNPNDDKFFMEKAIKEAEKAEAKGETPVGAVIVRDGQIIARGHNLRETKKNALLHAETAAIGKACKKLGGWRLPDGRRMRRNSPAFFPEPQRGKKNNQRESPRKKEFLKSA